MDFTAPTSRGPSAATRVVLLMEFRVGPGVSPAPQAPEAPHLPTLARLSPQFPALGYPHPFRRKGRRASNKGPSPPSCCQGIGITGRGTWIRVSLKRARNGVTAEEQPRDEPNSQAFARSRRGFRASIFLVRNVGGESHCGRLPPAILLFMNFRCDPIALRFVDSELDRFRDPIVCESAL